MKRLALLCAVLVACGGARKHVEEPDTEENEDTESESDFIEPLHAGPQPPLTATEDDLVAAIDRGPCQLVCATYTASVYRTGEIRYEGRWGVKTVGVVIERVTPKQIVLLDELFAEHDFASLAGEYTENAAMHHRKVTVWYRGPDGELLATVHDHGIRELISSELREIEDSVDRIVEIERWIGSDAERARLRQ